MLTIILLLEVCVHISVSKLTSNGNFVWAVQMGEREVIRHIVEINFKKSQRNLFL